MQRSGLPDPRGIAFLHEAEAGVAKLSMNHKPKPTKACAAYLACVMLVMPSVAFASEAARDFSVNEGDIAFLGSPLGVGVTAPDYSWKQLPGGTKVTLEGADTASPCFVAPDVALGGETLSFLVTISSGDNRVSDIVNVTVVNLNHPPVADAGEDQVVAGGSHVILSGENSFDIDKDPFTSIWVQTDGPSVILTGADGANPSFEAPHPGKEGVITLTFRLLVDDGFPMDAPAPGYVFENVTDTVSIVVTAANNVPFADAGADRTVEAEAQVILDGTGSADPDGDLLSYSWIQEPGGIPVILAEANTANPSFIAPPVGGSIRLVFTLTVDDGYGGISRASVSVYVLGKLSPPLAAAARSTLSGLWPPNHRMVAVGIEGIANQGVSIEITAVTQDEATRGDGDGDTPVDSVIRPDGTVLLRAERSAKGDGRVYRIHYTATNAFGRASGIVRIAVPRARNEIATDGGGLHDSTR